MRSMPTSSHIAERGAQGSRDSRTRISYSLSKLATMNAPTPLGSFATTSVVV